MVHYPGLHQRRVSLRAHYAYLALAVSRQAVGEEDDDEEEKEAAKEKEEAAKAATQSQATMGGAHGGHGHTGPVIGNVGDLLCTEQCVPVAVAVHG